MHLPGVGDLPELKSRQVHMGIAKVCIWINCSVYSVCENEHKAAFVQSCCFVIKEAIYFIVLSKLCRSKYPINETPKYIFQHLTQKIFTNVLCVSYETFQDSIDAVMKDDRCVYILRKFESNLQNTEDKRYLLDRNIWIVNYLRE